MVQLNIILIFTLSIHLFAFTIQGRMLHNASDLSSSTKPLKVTKEEKVMKGREIMGSIPPRCKGRCSSCGGHCIAVQVPSMWKSWPLPKIQYARGELSSDYMPITWKCKCGHFLFNP